VAEVTLQLVAHIRIRRKFQIKIDVGTQKVSAEFHFGTTEHPLLIWRPSGRIVKGSKTGSLLVKGRQDDAGFGRIAAPTYITSLFDFENLIDEILRGEREFAGIHLVVAKHFKIAETGNAEVDLPAASSGELT